MKTNPSFTVFACLILLATPHFLQAQETMEKVKDIVTEPKVYPPKPEGLTKRFPVGTPTVEASPGIATALGGTDASQTLRAPMENILAGSKRFLVRKDGKGSYGIVGTVTGLTISQGGEKKETVKDVVGLLTPFIKDKDKVQQLNDLAQGGSFVLNLANEEEIINVKCKVSLQLIDAKSTEIIESADGEVEKQISVKDMRISLGGIQIKEGAPPMKVVTEYNVSVVERAFFNALVALSPKLDTILADPNFVENKPMAARGTDVAGNKDNSRSDQSPNSPGKKRRGLNNKNSSDTVTETPAAPATPAPPAPAALVPSAPATPGSNEVARGAFCSKCGVKMAPNAKFCAGCGAKIAP